MTTKYVNPNTSHSFEALPSDSSTCRYCELTVAIGPHANVPVTETRREESEASPLPWRIAGGMVDGYAIVDADEAEVLPRMVLPANEGYEEDLRLIVHRVNSFETLVAALENLVAADNCNYDREVMRSEGYFDAARRALAEAKQIRREGGE